MPFTANWLYDPGERWASENFCYFTFLIRLIMGQCWTWSFANDMEETAPAITALIIVIIVIYDSLFRVWLSPNGA